MEDIERIPSPDGAYTVILVSVEMRMSHWLAQPLIVETASNRTILDLTPTLWSADAVQWSDDSAHVTLQMRRYPGDAPGATVIVDLSAQVAEIASPEQTAQVPLSHLLQLLAAYYERNRRSPQA
jgi:hypothetical protein